MTESHDGEEGADEADESTEYEEPERTTFDHDPVGHTHVWAGMSVGDLADQYGHAGIDQNFTADDIFRGADFSSIQPMDPSGCIQ